MITEKQREAQAIAGVSTEGVAIKIPLSRMGGVFVAGMTGSGKSEFIHSLLISILATSKSDDVKLLIGDPKKTDYKMYVDKPFMLKNPIEDGKEMVETMESLVTEIERRVDLFYKHGGFNNLDAYNEAVERGDIEGDRLPHIVYTIDEIAPLMMEYKERVETCIKQLAVKGGNCGVHFILATQMPRKEIIDGVIKTNIKTRFVLKVSNEIESLVALEQVGAEKLIGNGDFYFSSNGEKMQRGQAPIIEDEEMERIFNYLRRDTKPTPNLNIIKNWFGNEKNDKALFPLTLFNSRENMIKERSRLAKGLRKKIEKQTSEAMWEYIGVKLVNDYISNSVITLTYSFKSQEKKLPNLDNIQEILREILNESATIVTLSGRYIKVLVPLPTECRIPIDMKALIEEVL